ncbi:MAG: hypothetical protein ABFE07_13280 [Armatimonadia bacterium]
MRQGLTMHPEAERLFALDERLRREADEMLLASGIGSILDETGFTPVGSHVMHTMTWRDLDFERYGERDPAAHWKLGEAIARSPWTFRAQFEDFFRKGDTGYYWGFLAADPDFPGPVRRGHPLVWKLDVWQFPLTHRCANLNRRGPWQSLLSEESRGHVMALKETLCRDPRYGISLFSVDIYEAVLGQQIQDIQQFERWFEQRNKDSSG